MSTRLTLGVYGGRRGWEQIQNIFPDRTLTRITDLRDIGSGLSACLLIIPEDHGDRTLLNGLKFHGRIVTIPHISFLAQARQWLEHEPRPLKATTL